MAERIEILTGRFIANEGGNGAADSLQNKFTVNTGVDSVNIDTATAPNWYWVFSKAYSPYPRYISARDQVRILSMGVMIPYGFDLASTVLTLQFYKYTYMQGGAKVSVDVPEFIDYGGTVSSFTFPFVNYEFACDIISPFDPQMSSPATNPVQYCFTCKALSGSFSMVGVNSALNGDVITPIPFMKILHTIPVNG